MSLKSEINYKLTGTKAETLHILSEAGYNVPKIYFFTTKDWHTNKQKVILEIIRQFKDSGKLAVRSSSIAEDTINSSMAGAFTSLLNVSCKESDLTAAINRVIGSYNEEESNQVLVQPMVTNVVMSGVVMTQVLDDGSPYYVINYDDKSGLTDTVTSGSSINKTVYIYNGVKEEDFDSELLLKVLKLIRELQSTFPDIPLDIEFAIDSEGLVHLLQVRRIVTVDKWDKAIISQVSSRMIYLRQFIHEAFKPRPDLYGSTTLLGFMPDWNPAEMIGVLPHPLARSLYRKLITQSTWQLAREQMGYRKMPKMDLMVSLFGRVYIDVRKSINSFLPDGLPGGISEKLVNAFVDRLNRNPHLHDKIEFEIVHTAFDFCFEEDFESRYSGTLNREEFLVYKSLLRKLTEDAVIDKFNSSLNRSLRTIDLLKEAQLFQIGSSEEKNSFLLASCISKLIDECIELGTLPFSILARHGFIAESLLRSAVRKNAISKERLLEFRRSIITISGKMSEDYSSVIEGRLNKDTFLQTYGHLRPSSYDILSPNYCNRPDLFSEARVMSGKECKSEFKLTNKEESQLNVLIYESGFNGIDAKRLMHYAEQSIKGREYAKFIFTKHLSDILELAAKWGELKGFSRYEVSMLEIEDILNMLFEPLTNDIRPYYQDKISKAIENYDIASSFKLSYLIRSVRDVHIVPMQRSAANFIGNTRIEAEVVLIEASSRSAPDMEGKIVCIEGADPGYDWIFTRKIGGLVTKYGGANSHMAIRSAEYGIPAAIGCGEQPFERVLRARKCLLDCKSNRLEPITIQS
ncbi:pyruvate, phosphate dikinase [Roseivirga thermotolerans]|uniref:Pyruvate, phosphate dikinase n=1 Tax=Roseivirga thermotolerans TaxID=1758176 RepID=A0ABQ3IC36_9BACT|nr:pyruvate, phosphate dikinase [Roseivirga thermotolerans]|tara:strand:+ start:6047 stop:8452 length:2406 start_codon:yes stop_codon:yes gene_type:complete